MDSLRQQVVIMRSINAGRGYAFPCLLLLDGEQHEPQQRKKVKSREDDGLD